MSESGFVKANSNNLPRVDVFMISDFLKKDDRFNIAESGGSKASSASRESYGDNAVGYVELKRERSTCTVKGKVCPEHKVRSKAYSVSLTINEDDEQIMDVKCYDCVAAPGGCKHCLAFLMWVHRRSEDPAPTEITSYWQKPRMAGIGSSIKFIEVKDFSSAKSSGVQPSQLPDRDAFFKELMEEAKNKQINSQITRYNFETPVCMYDKLSLYKLMLSFKRDGGVHYRDFVSYAAGEMHENICREAEISTREQSNSVLWHELRHSRITASKVYEVAQCQRIDGTLVETVLGTHKVRDTRAMARGRKLEKEVLAVVEARLNTKFAASGLILRREYPIFGASPDAIISDFVVEVKCPTSEKTKLNYVKNNNITKKYKAQIHLQMLLAKKQKGLYCVADSNFEQTRNVTLLWVNFEESFITNVLEKAENFWKNYLYKIIGSFINY